MTTAVVILFAAIIGAVLTVYLSRSASRTAAIEHPEELESDPYHPDTKILHKIAADSPHVKKSRDVFECREQQPTEYLYYAEIDQGSVKDDGSIDLENCHFLAEVNVCFDQDFIQQEQGNLAHYRQVGFRSNRFSIDDELSEELGFDVFGELTPEDVSSASETMDYENLIELSDTEYSKFCYTAETHSVEFHHVSVDPRRVTTVKVEASGHFATMDWLYLHFSDMVLRYKNLPMQIFEHQDTIKG